MSPLGTARVARDTGSATAAGGGRLPPAATLGVPANDETGSAKDLHVLVVGGEDHDLRLPFMLALQRRGLRVTAAGTGSSAPFLRAGVPYRGFGFARFVNPLADWRALGAIRSLVAAVKPDVVQCFDTKLNILVPLALKGAAPGGPRLVRTINGRGWLYASTSPQAMALRPIYRALHRRACRATHAEVFEHAEDMAFFAAGGMIGAGGGSIIPGAGIDVGGFEAARAAGASPAVLRRELGLGDAPVVMTVTRMTRQKGIGTLLSAAALVHRTHPDVRFVLVGPRDSEGPNAIPASEIAAHAPYVIATGPRPDVPSLLGVADVFAFPTQYREGIPRALCEAALAGVPIVTSDMPGCRVVVEDGRNGRVVPAGDATRLARGIVELLDDRGLARRMAAVAEAPIRETYSLAAVADGYAALYRDIGGRIPPSDLGASA